MEDYFPCFESEKDFNDWQQMALDSGDNPGDPCQDCTVKYQALAARLGLCLYPDKDLSEYVDDEEEKW